MKCIGIIVPQHFSEFTNVKEKPITTFDICFI